MLSWPSASWICSIGTFPLRASLAKVLRTSWSASLSPIVFALSFFMGPICFSHPNGFSTSHRLLRLISYPGWCVVRPSIALRRFAVFCETCGVTRNSLTLETKSFVSYALSAPTVMRRPRRSRIPSNRSNPASCQPRGPPGSSSRPRSGRSDSPPARDPGSSVSLLAPPSSCIAAPSVRRGRLWW
jgi:hypothetical protein